MVVLGVARPQGCWPVAVFYPFGHPTPYFSNEFGPEARLGDGVTSVNGNTFPGDRVESMGGITFPGEGFAF
jgi:hypothetical protein